MKIVLAMTMVLLMSGGAMAQGFNAQGSAVVPNLVYFFQSGTYWSVPYITLSNITGENVTCNIAVYDDSGNDITHRATVNAGGTTNWSVVSKGTGVFEIPPYSTRMFHLWDSSSKICTVGYATIEWKSDNLKLRKA
ncbi:hypothetical protein ADUPG1_002416, partial [Aduncisulcus paluster]